MLLMFQKGIRGGICHAIHRYPKTNNKYIKDYDENKESSYLQYQTVNNLYGWVMSKKVPVNRFEWIKDTSQFNKYLIKIYNEESDEGYFLEGDVQYPQKLQEIHMHLLFLLERMELGKIRKLVTNLHHKLYT